MSFMSSNASSSTPSSLVSDVEITLVQKKAIESLTALLNKPLRIEIIDGRTFIGNLTCIDPQCNIILTNAEEFFPDPITPEEIDLRLNRDEFWPKSIRRPDEGEGWGGRQVGMILLPKKILVKVETEELWNTDQAGSS